MYKNDGGAADTNVWSSACLFFFLVFSSALCEKSKRRNGQISSYYCTKKKKKNDEGDDNPLRVLFIPSIILEVRVQNKNVIEIQNELLLHAICWKEK
jgi:hypothetical protein